MVLFGQFSNHGGNRPMRPIATLPTRMTPHRRTRVVSFMLGLLVVLLSFMPGVRGQDSINPLSTSAAPSSPVAVPASRKATNIAVITIHGPIDSDGVLAASVARRITTAARAGADTLVFDINTPGGDLNQVLRICNEIKKSPVPRTWAWINPDAYSGGAVIALACEQMIINEPASFGDAMVIGGGPFGIAAQAITPELQKKVLPPLIAEVTDSARRHNRLFGYNRDEYLVQAIVANDVPLWHIENPTTGQRICVDEEEFRMLFPDEPTSGMPRLARGPRDGRSNRGPDSDPPGFSGGDVAAGSAMLARISADVTSRLTEARTRPRITEADRGQWILLEKVTDGSAPAVLRSEDLMHFRWAVNDMEVVEGQTRVKPIRTDDDLRAFFQAPYLIRFNQTWSEGIVSFMTSIWVRGLLVVVFVLALFVEMTHPGTVLAGTISLLALVGLIAPPMLIGLASWWEVAAIGIGLVLLGVEVFVLPGFGVAGASGLLLIFAGLIATFVPRGGTFLPATPEARDAAMNGVVVVVLAMATASVGIWFIARNLGSFPVFNRLVLKTPLGDEEVISDVMREEEHDLPDLGATGSTISPLRPSGRIQIGDRVYDAVAEFGYIPAGEKVRVVSVTPMRIGVEAVPGSGSPTA
jgi:membrane-bound ClpP family serine protease